MKRIILCLIVFCVAAALVPSSPAQAKLDRTTTIDVSAVPPRDVFASLSRLLGYELAITPEIKKPVTMHLENVTVRTALTALSENLGCQWSIAGNTLRVQSAGSEKPGPAGIAGGGIGPGRGAGIGSGIGSGVGKVNYMQTLECRTPSNFHFDNTSLGSVTDALGKVCDMDIRVDESNKARMVTIDLSNRTILSALKAINEQTGQQRHMIISAGVQGSGKKMMIFIGAPPK
jgi:hypothetical protein